MKRITFMTLIFSFIFFNNMTNAVTLPNDSESTIKLIEKLANEEKFIDALEIAQQATQKWPSHELLKNWEACLLDMLDREEEAKPIFQELAEHANNNYQKSYALGRLALYARRAGDTEKALSYAKKSDRIQPTHQTKEAIAGVYYQIGQYKEAMNYYKKALSSMEDGYYRDNLSKERFKVSFKYNIAICLIRLEDLDEAKKIIYKISQNKPSCFYYIEYYSLLGETNLAAQELDKNLQCKEKPARTKMLRDIDKDIMKDLVKVKDSPEWQAIIKKWTVSN